MSDKKTKTAKFYSDSNFAHFLDAAEWRHAANYMTVDRSKLEIVFKGAIDPVLEDQCTAFGGVWK